MKPFTFLIFTTFSSLAFAQQPGTVGTPTSPGSNSSITGAQPCVGAQSGTLTQQPIPAPSVGTQQPIPAPSVGTQQPGVVGTPGLATPCPGNGLATPGSIVGTTPSIPSPGANSGTGTGFGSSGIGAGGGAGTTGGAAGMGGVGGAR